MSEIEKSIIQLKSDISTYQNMLNGANGELDADAIKIINASIKVYKTAIQALEEKLIKECGAVGDGITDDTEALQNVIDALEKQVPKKPIKSTLQCRYTYNKYPCCNGLTNGYQYDYCPHCGQKLDWSDSNE